MYPTPSADISIEQPFPKDLEAKKEDERLPELVADQVFHKAMARVPEFFASRYGANDGQARLGTWITQGMKTRFTPEERTHGIDVATAQRACDRLDALLREGAEKRGEPIDASHTITFVENLRYYIETQVMSPYSAVAIARCLPVLSTLDRDASHDLYNLLIATPKDKHPVAEGARAMYRTSLQALREDFPRSAVIEEAGHVHFNSEIPGATELRVYLSAEPPTAHVLIDLWGNALAETRLRNKIYFKVLPLTDRYEQIVLYKCEGTSDEDFGRALNALLARDATSVMMDAELPAAIRLAPGVALAPEPRTANMLMPYVAQERQSWHTFLAVALRISLEAAAAEAAVHNHSTTTMLEHAKNNLSDVLIAFDVNPFTLMPVDMRGGELPTWAQTIKKTYGTASENR